MLKWLLPIMVVYCNVACTGCRACTLIGCLDGAGITIHRADWTMAPLTVDLEIDGDTVTCADLVPINSIQKCDDARVEVTYFPLADCSGCEPNGQHRLTIAIAATPSRINATMSENDVVVGQRTFNPTYTLLYPNGEQCDESGCRHWTGSWEIP